MRFDLLIRGARLVDALRPTAGRQDVAFAGDTVAAVGDLSGAEAGQTIDAAGLIVTPGLVDLHAHVYWGASGLGIDHGPVWAKSGTTTIVDGGSAGAANFAAFRRFIIEPSRCRLLAFLNISALGLTGSSLAGEASTIGYCDVGEAVRVVEENRDVVVGVKVRAERDAVGQNGLASLDLALAAAERVGVPVMVHAGQTPPALASILGRLRRGDILTHCYTDLGDTVLNAAGHVRDYVWQARERGVWFDCAHGSRRLSFAVARAALADGFAPDSISTDLNTLDIARPVVDLPTTMSKLLNLGMSLEDVVARSSALPAQMIGWGGRLGSLQAGCAGDLVAFELQDGAFSFYDSRGAEMVGRQRLQVRFTVRAGRLAYPIEAKQ
jgi:dihydroorotase